MKTEAGYKQELNKRYWLILLVFPVVVIMFLWLPWLLMQLGIQGMPDPPKPEITYGEFPFRLEYEMNGQIVVVEDTLICEFGGISADEGRGKFRIWKSYLASGEDEILLLEVANPIENWKGTPRKQIIYYNPGAAGYYMGDMGEGVTYTHNFPDASIYEEYADGSTMRGKIEAKELHDNFHIVLLDWRYTPPIENTFK